MTAVGHLSRAQGGALYVAAVLGPGILTLPALAAGVAGPAMLVALAALLLLSVPLAATFAALGVRRPDSGGIAGYATTAFGPAVGAVTGYWFYLGVPVGVPALVLFGGGYVEAAVGGGTWVRTGSAVVLLAVATGLNAGGLRVSGRAQLVLTGALVALLVLAIALSLPHARIANLSPFAPHGWAAVVPAALVLVWCLTGWEVGSHLSGEFRDPRRDIRGATAGALAVVAALFGGVSVAVVTVLGPLAGGTEAPLAALLGVAFGAGGAAVAVVTAVVLTLGTTSAYLAGLANLGAALGRDGAAPRWLAEGAQPGGVPRRSLAVVAGWSAAWLIAATSFGWSVEQLVLATTASQVAVYLVGSAAGVRLLPRGSAGRRSAFVALGASTALLVLCGIHLLIPLGVALVALLVRLLHRSRPATPPHLDAVPEGLR